MTSQGRRERGGVERRGTRLTSPRIVVIPRSLGVRHGQPVSEMLVMDWFFLSANERALSLSPEGNAEGAGLLVAKLASRGVGSYDGGLERAVQDAAWLKGVSNEQCKMPRG